MIVGLTRVAELSVRVPCVRAVPGAFPGLRRIGKGGGLVSGSGVRECVTVGARPEEVQVARAFVGGVLGASHPCADVAVLLASELVTNSVRHSGSAVPGGLVTVTVAAGEDVIRVEVTDRCAGSVPVLLPPAGGEAEGSRGMRLVEELAARWGYERGAGQAMTWFELHQG